MHILNIQHQLKVHVLSSSVKGGFDGLQEDGSAKGVALQILGKVRVCFPCGKVYEKFICLLLPIDTYVTRNGHKCRFQYSIQDHLDQYPRFNQVQEEDNTQVTSLRNTSNFMDLCNQVFERR